MQKSHLLLLGFTVLAGISWGVYELKYYFSYRSDLHSRPWAYNEDAKAKLLVGQWHGTFIDPNGLQKNLALEIVVPVTEEERQKKAAKRLPKRKGLGGRKEKQIFEGAAVVNGPNGREDYEVWGSVNKEDFHKLNELNFRANEQTLLRKNFSLNLATEGNWHEDTLSLKCGFSYITEEGSRYSSSEGVVRNGVIEWQDSQYDKVVNITLQRGP